jgi:hypothetical protein
MRYFIASAGQRWLQAQGVMAGRRIGDDDALVPDGDVHAVPVGGEVTMCGLDLERLVRFDELDFETSSYVTQKCEDCGSSIAADSGS